MQYWKSQKPNRERYFEKLLPSGGSAAGPGAAPENFLFPGNLDKSRVFGNQDVAIAEHHGISRILAIVLPHDFFFSINLDHPPSGILRDQNIPIFQGAGIQGRLAGIRPYFKFFQVVFDNLVLVIAGNQYIPVFQFFR